MSILARPAKQGGGLTYQAKVIAGFTKIIDTEVDADLDTLYAAWNAGADTVNIKDAAVTAVKLAAGAAKTNLTATKATIAELAVGAVVNTSTMQSSEATTAIATSEAIVLEGVLGALRGSQLLVAAVLGGYFDSTGAVGGDNTLTAILREGGTAAVVDGTVRRTMVTIANPADSGGAVWSASTKIPAEVVALYAVNPAVSTRWKLTASYNPGASSSRFVRRYAYLFAMELA